MFCHFTRLFSLVEPPTPGKASDMTLMSSRQVKGRYGGESSEIRFLSHGMTVARRLHGQILERQVDEARSEVLNCMELNSY